MANSMKNSVENGSHNAPGIWWGALRGAGLSAEPTARASAVEWNRRAVRCVHCRELAREEAREQLSSGDVVIRYCCDNCGWPQTRRYGATAARTA